MVYIRQWNIPWVFRIFSVYARAFRDHSLFIGGGEEGGLGEKFQKTLFLNKTPLNKAKKLGPPTLLGNYFNAPPPNYNIQLNIITKFSILLINTFLHAPATLPLHVVVINWACSSPSDVSSQLPNSSIISSSESSLVVSVSSSHIDRAVTKDCTCPVFGRNVWLVIRLILSKFFPDFGRWW